MSSADPYAAHLGRLTATYDRVLDEAGFDAVLVHAGFQQLQHPADDGTHPFRPTPSFMHFLPLREPGAAIHYVPGRRPRLLRPKGDDFWSGAPPLEAPELLSHFEQVPVGEGLPALAQALSLEARTTFVGQDPAHGEALSLPQLPASALATLDALRAIKSPYEQGCIAEANGRAARGHRAIAEAFADGERRELHLHLRYLAATEQDASDTPYPNIVAVGAHAGVLHHAHYARDAVEGPTSLLVDAGAQARGYHADVTRTWVAGEGEAAARFSALVQGVDTLQQRICAELRPGLAYEAIHDGYHAALATLLVELGLAHGSAEALVETGATRALFPHGLGHSLGLQTHDVGCRTQPPREDNRFLRCTTTLAAGQVLTIEPGCYFIPALLSPLRATAAGALLNLEALEAVRPFGGLRIEDDVLITADGARNLTREAWRALDG